MTDRRGDGPVPASEQLPAALDTPRRLLIGPANSAGQGYQWVSAAARNLPGVSGHSFRLQHDANPFPTHYRVESRTFRRDRDWAAAFAAYACRSYTHVVLESNLPMFGPSTTGSERDIARLRDAGVSVAMIAHGSDVRVPSSHAAREKWHQYQYMPAETVEALEAKAVRNVEAFRRFDGPTFVSTLGLMDFVPEARWCPVVVEPARWSCDRPVLEAPVPVVGHIPSSQQKGSAWIDQILGDLATEGRITYLRLSGVAQAEMPSSVAGCDIVIDQFGTADYGVAACEAMAAGRLVVSMVADSVRQRVREETGLDLPIVEADPDSLGEVIIGLLGDRESGRATAERGPAFVAQAHDGSHAARALEGFIDTSSGSQGWQRRARSAFGRRRAARRA